MTTAVRHIPNLITTLRVLLTPLSAHFILRGEYICAAAVIAVIGLTDVSDGAVARALGVCSRLGSVFDVVADLLFIAISLLALNLAGLAPVWFSAIVACKFLEFWLTSRDLNKDDSCKNVWAFDRMGRCFAAMVFLFPGAICLSAFLFENMKNIACFYLIPACAVAAVSSVQRIVACLRKKLSQIARNEADSDLISQKAR
jgi:phosphatidylglycerophosphate synthase